MAPSIVIVRVGPELHRGVLIQPDLVVTNTHFLKDDNITDSMLLRVYPVGLHIVRSNFSAPTLGQMRRTMESKAFRGEVVVLEGVQPLDARIKCFRDQDKDDWMMARMIDPLPAGIEPLSRVGILARELRVLLLGEGKFLGPLAVPHKEEGDPGEYIRVPGFKVERGWSGSAVVDNGGNVGGIIIRGSRKPAEAEFAKISPAREWKC